MQLSVDGFHAETVPLLGAGTCGGVVPVATTAAWTGGCEDIVPLASASEFCAGISDGLVSTVQLLLLLGLELRTT